MMGITVEKRAHGPWLNAFRVEWDALLENSSRPSIFSTHDYVSLSLEHYKGAEEVFFLLFRENDQLIAIYPMSLWREKRRGVSFAVLSHGVVPAESEIDKPYPLIAAGRERACWTRFAEYFKTEDRAWDVLDYDELVAESALATHAAELFRAPAYHARTRPGPDSPIIDLSGAWDDFWNHHRKLRKKTRRLERALGDRLNYVITNDPAEMDDCLTQYIATEKISWKQGGMVAENEAFYRALTPRLAAEGRLWFGLLRDADEIVSIEVAYTYRDQIYFCHGTYAPKHAALSPGAVNSAWFIRHFHGKGFVEGDYLAGYADYVAPWASRHQRTVDVVIRRVNLKFAWFAVDHFVRVIKRRFARRKSEVANDA